MHKRTSSDNSSDAKDYAIIAVFVSYDPLTWHEELHRIGEKLEKIMNKSFFNYNWLSVFALANN